MKGAKRKVALPFTRSCGVQANLGGDARAAAAPPLLLLLLLFPVLPLLLMLMQPLLKPPPWPLSTQVQPK